MKTIKFLFCLVLLASSLSQAAITYVHTDHLGSVVAESNQAGQKSAASITSLSAKPSKPSRMMLATPATSTTPTWV